MTSGAGDYRRWVPFRPEIGGLLLASLLAGHLGHEFGYILGLPHRLDNRAFALSWGVTRQLADIWFIWLPLLLFISALATRNIFESDARFYAWLFQRIGPGRFHRGLLLPVGVFLAFAACFPVFPLVLILPLVVCYVLELALALRSGRAAWFRLPFDMLVAGIVLGGLHGSVLAGLYTFDCRPGFAVTELDGARRACDEVFAIPSSGLMGIVNHDIAHMVPFERLQEAPLDAAVSSDVRRFLASEMDRGR